MFFTCFAVIALILSGCDPGSGSRRVKPDKTTTADKLPADVYLSKDHLVEFQVYNSSALGVGVAPLKAVIVNNRKSPIQIDLSRATFRTAGSDKVQSATGAWHEGCSESSPSSCKSNIVQILPGQSMHVSWTHAAAGEFRLPFIGADHLTEILVAHFEQCSPFWGKC